MIFLVYNNRENYTENPNVLDKSVPDPNCACVFDIDETITCGLPNAAKAVETCKEHNCRFALNTARGAAYYEDVKFHEIGLDPNLIKNDVHIWNQNAKATYASQDDMLKEIAENKVAGLEELQKKYSVPKHRIILFDDNNNNITKAQKSGYAVVHAANAGQCGLPNNVQKIISDILDE
jgi:hypothetical protein